MAELGAVNGAAFVRWPDGRDGVLTRVSEPVDQLTHTAEILDLARARGVPVPRYDLVAAIGTDTVIVQERLPGAPTPRHVDLPMIEAVIALTESFTGVLRDRSWAANAVAPGARVVDAAPLYTWRPGAPWRVRIESSRTTMEAVLRVGRLGTGAHLVLTAVARGTTASCE